MERDKRETAESKARIQAHPFVAQVMEIFPGAEITAIRARPKPVVEDAAPVAPEDERPDTDEDD